MSRQENPTAATKSGEVQGKYEDGLYVFRGIPYAAAPVGPRRWLPPEPLEPWQGVRPAERFGPVAPQKSGSLLPSRELPPEPYDEDCLFLNIWTPGLDDRNRPVMVWIHGGAFIRGSGSSPRHPGDTLARRGDVVLVSLNYRMGPLGFMNLRDATSGAIPATGNEGLLDQVAALKWVRENISAFGGNPENITAFGESAGAMSIGCLLAMPDAKGLFPKAILQSGANTYRPLDQAVRISRKYLEKFGIEEGNIQKLMSLSADSLLEVQLTLPEVGRKEGESQIHGAIYEPVADGVALPGVPLDIIKTGSVKDVIVLTGSNLEEAKLFGLSSQNMKNLDKEALLQRVERQLPLEYGAAIIDQYREIREKRGQDASPGEILMAILTDQQFRIPNVRLAEIQNSLGAKSYNYLFNWESTIPGLGACHGLDVGFVFNKCEDDFHGSGPEAERLVEHMQDAWIAFARSGDPSCESLGEWPAYGDNRNTMILGRDSRVLVAPYEEERRIWDPVPNAHLG